MGVLDRYKNRPNENEESKKGFLYRPFLGLNFLKNLLGSFSTWSYLLNNKDIIKTKDEIGTKGALGLFR